MSNLRDQIWDRLREAGTAGVTVALLAASLGTTPETVLSTVMDDMLEGDVPAIYCAPGPRLVPRRMPEPVEGTR